MGLDKNWKKFDIREEYCVCVQHAVFASSTVSSKIYWPRWPINFLLNSSDLCKTGAFFVAVTRY